MRSKRKDVAVWRGGAGRLQGLITAIRRGVGSHFDDGGHIIWAPRRIMHLDGGICCGDGRAVQTAALVTFEITVGGAGCLK